MSRPASNRTGLERTIKALNAAGRLGDADQALIALARSLAAAVDAEPENAALAREYRTVLVALSVAGADHIDDDTRDFLLTIRTPRAPLGDGQNAAPRLVGPGHGRDR